MGGFEAVDQRYTALHARAVDVFADDPRVVRVDVHGSIATETADEWSDLDLKVIARDADLGAVVEEWETWLAAIAPTVFAARPLAPFVVNAITDDGLTLDVSVWGESAADFPMPTGLAVGFLSGARFDHYPDAVAYAVHESLRGTAGPLIKFLKRGEHVTHLSGIGHSLSLLVTVLLAETDAPINPRRPSDELNGDQLAVIAALPPVAATYDALLAFELAISRGVITRGRRLFERYGIEWPAALAAVAATNVTRALHVDAQWLT